MVVIAMNLLLVKVLGTRHFAFEKKVRNNIHEWCACVRQGELVTPYEFPRCSMAISKWVNLP
jgi:hypothetical protein